MKKHIRISLKLLEKLNMTSPITRLCLGLDKRMESIDRAVFAVVAAEIRSGRQNVSLGTICSEVAICHHTARNALRRLRWCGYLRADERLAGPDATKFGLGMPFETRWEMDVPREPSPADIPMPSPQATLPDNFDANRHRALGIKLGFGPTPTDALQEMRRLRLDPPPAKG